MRRFAMLLLTIGLTACSASTDDGAQVQSYTVGGVLRQLPSGPSRELMIEHEAIADFVDAAGDTVGMGAMTMGFPVADGVDLSGFAVGDSILFTFEVRWEGSPPLRLVGMQRRR